MAAPLDVLLCFDTTASMTPVLVTVRQRLAELTDTLFGTGDAALAVMAVGDYDTGDQYVVQHRDFTADAGAVKAFLGGVAPVRNHWNEGEAYEQALRAAKTLAWRPASRKVVVLVGDDKPHPPTFPANTERVDWRAELADLTAMDIPVYAVQCASLDIPRSEAFYRDLAAAHPRGAYVLLTQFAMIHEMLMALLYHAHDDLGGLQRYEQALRDDGRYNRNMEVALNGLLGRQDARAAAAPVDARAAPVPPGRFQRLHVDAKASIKAFVTATGAAFQTGRGFYQLTKPETVSAKKEVVVEDVASGEMFSGEGARALLGLPTTGAATLAPAAVPAGKRVFVQSKSVTRALQPGTHFLYELDRV